MTMRVAPSASRAVRAAVIGVVTGVPGQADSMALRTVSMPMATVPEVQP